MRTSAHRIPAAMHSDRRQKILRPNVHEAVDDPAQNGTRRVVIYLIDGGEPHGGPNVAEEPLLDV